MPFLRLFLDYPFSVAIVFGAVQEAFFSEITDISFDVSLTDFYNFSQFLDSYFRVMRYVLQD